MFNEHFNERAQVHRYNCSNLLLQVSAVGFYAGSFATRLGGTCVAKCICMMLCFIRITFATLVPHRRVENVSARKTTAETHSNRFEQLYRWTLKCSLNIGLYIISIFNNFKISIIIIRFCTNCAAMIVAKVSSA